MPLEVQRSLQNVHFSLFRFLNDNVYTVAGVDGKLKEHFPDLMIRSSYPDDLTALTTPLLALGGVEAAEAEPDFFGAAIFGVTYRIPLYGFVLNQGTDARHRQYRDRLMSDLYEMFSNQANDQGFALYDADTKQLVSDESLEVTTARARQLPANAPDIPADRYKFQIDIDVNYQ